MKNINIIFFTLMLFIANSQNDYKISEQIQSASQIESMINRNRAQQILDLVKKVLSSSNKCEVKAAYLNDLLGKVLVGIEVKKLSVNNLNSLLQAARSQIQKLKAESSNAQNQNWNLNLDSLQQKFNDLTAKMKDAQLNFKACNANKQKQEASNLQIQLSNLKKQSQEINMASTTNNNNIAQLNLNIQSHQQISQNNRVNNNDVNKINLQLQSLQKQIEDIKASYQANLDRLDRIKLELQQQYGNLDKDPLLQEQKNIIQKNQNLQIQFKNLQNRIADTKNRLNNVKKINRGKKTNYIQNKKNDDTQNSLKIAKSKASDLQNQLNNIQNKISVTQNKLAIANGKVKDANNRCKKLQSIFNDASNLASKANQDYVNATNKLNSLDQKIKSNTVEIDRSNQEIFANQDKIKVNQKGADDFSAIVDQMKETIQYAYYRCYGVLEMTVNHKAGSDPLFYLKMMSWTSYLNKCYEFKLIDKNQKYTTPTSIFSKSFRDAYGLPLSSQMQAAAKKDSPSLTFNGDFSCANNLNNLVAKKGTIKQVTTKYIDVNDNDGSVKRLLLSSCTRFDGVGENILPKAGLKIVWKASNSSNGYLLHAATLI